MDTNTNKKTKKISPVNGLVIILISFLISTMAIAFFLLQRDTIYNGVAIENIDVSNLSTIEAQNRIKDYFEKYTDNDRIQFVYGDKIWNVTGRDIGYTYNYTQAVNEAYNVGREGNYFERIQKIISLYKIPHSISLLPTYDSTKIEGLMNELKKTINKPYKDAKITRTNGKFVIKQEVVGLKVDTEKLKELISKEMKNVQHQAVINIAVPVQSESPRITSESLSFIQDLIGEYATQFNATNKSRTHNIALAARTINGTVLMPGDIFSFNDLVGPRTAEKGYENAPVILKGELVEGLGGGVCQVSSTIYNAVLFSNLNIVERISHSIPSTYVPKGRDATVSYGILDFKFQNAFSQPIYIESFIRENQLLVRIYGYKTSNKMVKILSVEDEVIKKTEEIKYDPKMLQGKEEIEQEGRDGYKVTTYKITYENGVEVKKEKISKDFYKPQKRIVIKGTKKPPAPPKPKTASEDNNSSTSEENEEVTNPQ